MNKMSLTMLLFILGVAHNQIDRGPGNQPMQNPLWIFSSLAHQEPVNHGN